MIRIGRESQCLPYAGFFSSNQYVKVLSLSNYGRGLHCDGPFENNHFQNQSNGHHCSSLVTQVCICNILPSLDLCVFSQIGISNKTQYVSGVTVLLALTVFNTMVNEILPKVSDALPILGQMMADNICQGPFYSLCHLSPYQSMFTLQIHL